MAFTEVTNQGFFSRLAGSIKGVLVGLLLFVAAFPLLYWNEGRAALHSQAYGEGRGEVVQIQPDWVDPALEGKLVHLSGQASGATKLEDRDFGVGVQGALRLKRTVEMYQWQEKQSTEKRKKVGGGEETTVTYTYEKVWSPEPIDSSRFKERGYDNVGSMPYKSSTQTSPVVNLGVWKLGPDLTEQADNFEKLPAEEHHDPFNRDNSSPAHQPYDGGIYVGRNPSSPEIGDMRVQYQVIRPCLVSIVAGQQGDSFAPYRTSKGVGISTLMVGDHSSMAVFDKLEQDNTVLTWVLRVVGFFLMVFGLASMFGPFVVMADVIPVVGDLLGTGVFLFSMLVATPLALVTMALGWITARPLVGVGLLAVAGVVAFGAFKMARARKKP